MQFLGGCGIGFSRIPCTLLMLPIIIDIVNRNNILFSQGSRIGKDAVLAGLEADALSGC
jgi:hypothetical protein